MKRFLILITFFFFILSLFAQKTFPQNGVYDFRDAKNVRNPLISKILEKYDEENRN